MKLLSLALCASFLVMSITDGALVKPLRGPEAYLEVLRQTCIYVKMELANPGSTSSLKINSGPIKYALKRVNGYSTDQKKRAEFCEELYIDQSLKGKKPPGYPTRAQWTGIACSAVFADEDIPGSLDKTVFKYPESLQIVKKIKAYSSDPAKRSKRCKEMLISFNPNAD